MIVVELRNI